MPVPLSATSVPSSATSSAACFVGMFVGRVAHDADCRVVSMEGGGQSSAGTAETVPNLPSWAV